MGRGGRCLRQRRRGSLGVVAAVDPESGRPVPEREPTLSAVHDVVARERVSPWGDLLVG